MRRRQFLTNLALAASMGLVRPARGDLRTGKLLEWGWGTPSPTYVRDHIRVMEQLPFDGLILDPVVNGGPSDTSGRFGWHVWGNKALRADDYLQSIDALQHTPWQQFTEIFLRFNVTPGEIDWYDMSFQTVLANASLAAGLVQQCHLTGLLFDVEHYQGEPFRYPSQQRRGVHSFIEYQNQVRQCGREFMSAINAVHPTITILLTYGYSLALQSREPLNRATYGLLPAFLDGMLEVAAPATLIFDGWEAAYGYKTEQQFREAYEIMRQHGQHWTSVQEAYRQHYRSSFGVWVDCCGSSWDTSDYTRNYFTPNSFEQTVRLALQYTDRYVWIRSEKADWWDGKMPQPYIEALQKARTS